MPIQQFAIDGQVHTAFAENRYSRKFGLQSYELKACINAAVESAVIQHFPFSESSAICCLDLDDRIDGVSNHDHIRGAVSLLPLQNEAVEN